MGRPFLISLAEPGERAYCCGVCRTHLAAADALVSRAFHARSGRAYLFAACFNVNSGPDEQRVLTTGVHVVSDVTCVCGAAVGWKYVSCPADQEYKTSKFCLERAAVVDLVEPEAGGGGEAGLPVELLAEDTDDEEEEEDGGGGGGRPASLPPGGMGGLVAMVGAWGWPAAAAVAATRGAGPRR